MICPPDKSMIFLQRGNRKKLIYIITRPDRYQTCNSPSVKKFVRKYVERRLQWERVVRMEQMRLCAQTLQRFPDANEEGLRERFPLIDVDQVKRWKKVKGHHGNFQWNVWVSSLIPQYIQLIQIQRPTDLISRIITLSCVSNKFWSLRAHTIN